MSNFTFANVTRMVRSSVLENVNGNQFDSIDDLVSDLANADASVEVIYNSDAWSIVNDGDFPAVDCDFSGCNSALDCVLLEAQMAVNEVAYEAQSFFAYTIREAAEAVDIFAEDNGFIFAWCEVEFGSILDRLVHQSEMEFGEYNGCVYHTGSDKLDIVLQVEGASIRFAYKKV